MAHRLRRTTISFVLAILAGCGEAPAPPEIVIASGHLQLSDPEAALEALSGVDGHSTAHYLSGVALMQLDRLDAARSELQAARELEDSPAIQACQLKLRLFARDLRAADELIALELNHPSNPAVSLACVYAYEALAVNLAANERHEAAAAHRRRAGASLKNSLALSDRIPEFHAELLDFAAEYQQANAAVRLVARIRRTHPEHLPLQRREILLLQRAGNSKAAIVRSRKLHLRAPDNRDLATLYASTLADATSSIGHDATFQQMRRRFPGHVPLIACHARYLASNYKLTSACQVLATALSSRALARENSSVRWPLIQAAIALPLQAGSPGLATQQLNRYRAEVPDEMLVTYYEAQLLHLKRDYVAAREKMTEVLREQLARTHRRDPLVTDAVRWLQRIREAERQGSQSARRQGDQAAS
tara:strand:+ start:298 stop:1551 length:1254 start_codon:yes stop_codon:yes gene_type:complete